MTADPTLTAREAVARALSDRHCNTWDSLIVPAQNEYRADAAAALAALGILPETLDGLRAGRLVAVPREATARHKRRGTSYDVLGTGRLQTGTPLTDMAGVVIYRGASGDLWCRPPAEFHDGRFELLAPRPGADAAGGGE